MPESPNPPDGERGIVARHLPDASARRGLGRLRERTERLAVPFLNGVSAVAAFATIWVEMSLTTKIAASVIVVVALAASTIIQWRIIDASHDESERREAAQGARDKLGVARQREIVGMIQAHDSRGAIEALQTEIALREPTKPLRSFPRTSMHPFIDQLRVVPDDERYEREVAVYAVPSVADSTNVAAGIMEAFHFAGFQAKFFPEGPFALSISDDFVYYYGLWIIGRRDGLLDRLTAVFFQSQGYNVFIEDQRQRSATMDIIVGADGEHPLLARQDHRFPTPRNL